MSTQSTNGLEASTKRVKAKLEYRRRKIEQGIEKAVAELAEKYPDVDIGMTGTLSKSNPDFIDLRIMVEWRR